MLPKEQVPYGGKYTTPHARQYFEKHQTGLGRRLSTWRERSMVQAALERAGNPESVLDIPCGAGRFWPVFLEKTKRSVFAADLNQPMLHTGLQLSEAVFASRVKGFVGSAFSIPFRDNAVESVVSIRLLHHFSKREQRLGILREMARVASRTVIVTLWVDGNWKAMRRREHDRRKPRTALNRFVVGRAEIEAEFKESGLAVIDCVHFLKFYSMWAAYVLRKD